MNMQSLIDLYSFAIKFWYKIKFKTMNIDDVNVAIDHRVTSEEMTSSCITSLNHNIN